jgi:hypothetical protein
VVVKKGISQAEAIILLKTHPTVPPQVAGAAYGLAKNASYEAVQRGEIESRRFGRKIVCPSAPILKDLGLVSLNALPAGKAA